MPRLLPSSKWPKCQGPLKHQTTPAGTLFMCQTCDKDDPIKRTDNWLKGDLKPPNEILMFGTTRELLLWIVGFAVAGVVTIWAAFYAVDHFLAPHDSSDPLTSKGGLGPRQDIRGK